MTKLSVKKSAVKLKNVFFPAYREDAPAMPGFLVKKIMAYGAGGAGCLILSVSCLFSSQPETGIIFLFGVFALLAKALSYRNGFARNQVVVTKGYIKTVSSGSILKPFQRVQVYTKSERLIAEIMISKQIHLAERGQYIFYFLKNETVLNYAVYNGSAGNFIGYEPVYEVEAADGGSDEREKDN